MDGTMHGDLNTMDGDLNTMDGDLNTMDGDLNTRFNNLNTRFFTLVIMSFGYQTGIPTDECEVLFNVRGVKNPPHAMRKAGKTGVDKELRRALFTDPATEEKYFGIRSEIVEKLTSDQLFFSRLSDIIGTDPPPRQRRLRRGSFFETRLEKRDYQDWSSDEDSDAEGSSDDEKKGEGEEQRECDVPHVPSDEDEGDCAFVVGVGCELGKHRSVAFVERLCSEDWQGLLKGLHIDHSGKEWEIGEVIPFHRDINSAKFRKEKNSRRGSRAAKGRAMWDE